MSSTGINTQTFTVADIRKVVENFSADYAMIAESTRLHSESTVRQTNGDVHIFAAERLLAGATIILTDSSGTTIKAAKYFTSENASGWPSDRPGNAIWPYTSDGKLHIIVSLSDPWWEMTDLQRSEFRRRTGLVGRWGRTSMDTSMSKMIRSTGQRYSSNGYGLQRENFDLR